MQKLLPITFLVFLLLSGLTHSEDAEQTSTYKFIDSTSDTLKTDANLFLLAGQTAGGAVPGTLGSMYDAFSPGYCGPNQFTFDSGWISMTLLALMTVFMVVILIYMAGHMVQSPTLIATAKEEWYQIFMTLLRIVFIFSILFVTTQWFGIRTSNMSDPIYGLPNMSLHIDAAMAFSRMMITEMVTTFSNLVMYNMVIHTIFSATMWFGITWRAMYSFNMGPVLKPLIDLVGMALQFLSLGIGEWMLHLIMLCLIKKWTWSLFIPVGIFLRAFPQTRGAGEALFAIVFALALIYPLMFLVTYETHKIMKGNLIEGDGAIRSFVQKSGILAVAGSVVVTMFLFAGVFFPFFVGMALDLAFELIRNAVYYAVIMSILLPFLNIFITLTAAREFARFFSVDVSFMSFVKVI